jgi:hypothetical protein
MKDLRTVKTLHISIYFELANRSVRCNGRKNKAFTENNNKILPPFQIISRFDFFCFINFAMYLDMLIYVDA